MWRNLFAKGQWPHNAPPLWHGRSGDVDWHYDLTNPIPEQVPSDIYGVIVLAGCTSGDTDDMAFNQIAAQTALDMAQQHDLGPVILCSSQSVYAPQSGAISEETTLAPPGAYGIAKAAMEQAADRHQHPNCSVRIANVAGADMVLLNAAKGSVTLDQLANGQSPQRMYITPENLAEALLSLVDNWTAQRPPAALNIAQPGLIEMSDVLDAAGAGWQWKPAPPNVIPTMELDLSTQSKFLTLPPSTPSQIAQGARDAGWPEVAH